MRNIDDQLNDGPEKSNKKDKANTLWCFELEKNKIDLSNFTENGKDAFKSFAVKKISGFADELRRIQYQLTKDVNNLEVTASTVSALEKKPDAAAEQKTDKQIKRELLNNRIVAVVTVVASQCASLFLIPKFVQSSFYDIIVKAGLIICVAALVACAIIKYKDRKE